MLPSRRHLQVGSAGVTDHGLLTGLSDDDHAQYALLAGRSGGQTLNGGLNAGDILTLRGSASSPDSGIVEIESPITLSYDTFSNTTPAQQFAMRWAPTVGVSSNYVGGALSTSGVFNVTTAVFIPAIFSDTNRYNIGANPGFSAITFINELSAVANNGNFNLPSALVMNIGLTHERNTAGTSTSPGTTGVSFSPQTRTTVSGAVMTKTSQTAVRCSPTHSTVSGSTVNYGTIRGLHCFSPTNAIFQPQSGVENITAYYGVDMNNITLFAASPIAVVRSALTAGTNRWFLLNNGGAKSDLGGGDLLNCRIIQCLTDSFGISLGAAGGDVQILWDGSNLVYNPVVGDNMEVGFTASNEHFISSANFGSGSDLCFGYERFAFGQLSSLGNQVGLFVAPTRTTGVNGDWSDYLLTQGGNITVDHTISTLAGWTINAPSITIGTGSITNGTALLVGGNVNAGTNRTGVRIISNPTGGAGVNAALWVTAGRAQFDGFVDINKPIALGGGAAATLGTIGGAGPTAAAQAQWVQIEVNGVNHWIPAWT